MYDEEKCEEVCVKVCDDDVNKMGLVDVDETTSKGILHSFLKYSLNALKILCVNDCYLNLPYNILENIIQYTTELHNKIQNLQMLYDMASYDKLVVAVDELKESVYKERLEKDKQRFKDYDIEYNGLTQKAEKILTELVLSHNENYIRSELLRLKDDGIITALDMQAFCKKYPNYIQQMLQEKRSADSLKQLLDSLSNYNFQNIINFHRREVKTINSLIIKILSEYKTVFSSYTPSYRKSIKSICDIFGICENEATILEALYVIYGDIEYSRFLSRTYQFIDDNTNYIYIKPLIVATGLRKEEIREAIKNIFSAGLGDTLYPDLCEDIRLYSDLRNLLEKEELTKQEIINILIGITKTTDLTLKDFGHIPETNLICDIIKNGIKNGTTGINILLYGLTGTGKTEYAKVISKALGYKLFIVKEDVMQGNRENDDSVFSQRIGSLKRLQKFLGKNNKCCILLDEAEDIFPSERYNDGHSKSEINRILEENIVPVFWTSNKVFQIDDAYLRRFTFSVKFEELTDEMSYTMWKKELKKTDIKLSQKQLKDLSVKYKATPAIIKNSLLVSSLSDKSLETIKNCLKHGEQLAGKEHIDKDTVFKKVDNFEPKLLNTDVDLVKLSDRLKDLKRTNFSLCLYGAPGTGKSAYGAWLAKKLRMPLIKKRCSDLLSMWVGEAEKNIAKAFEEAKAKKAILLFDEADSFLQDRRGAVRSWEVTQVNEMLTQMENASYPFICTTNLKDSLDQASLRRFTFKVKYDFMNEKQKTLAFYHFFGFKDVSLKEFEKLTPADFDLVKQKAEILDCLSDKDELINMLRQEYEAKEPTRNKMGF